MPVVRVRRVRVVVSQRQVAVRVRVRLDRRAVLLAGVLVLVVLVVDVKMVVPQRLVGVAVCVVFT